MNGKHMSTTTADLKTVRVDQVGSLAGPKALIEVMRRYRRGEIDDKALQAARDDAVRHVLKRQEEIGFPILSEGELRRTNWQDSFGSAVSGYDIPSGTEDFNKQNLDPTPFSRSEQDFYGPGPAIVTRRPVKQRLQLVRNVPLEEYRFASRYATSPVKATLVGPDRVAQRFAWERSQNVYKDMDEFVSDVVAIQRRMIQELVDAGCRYVQIDAPGYTAYVDPVSLERMKSRGEDPEENLRRSIAADNAVIAGFEGVTFGIHICRGNPRTIDPKTGKVVAQWHREGHYDPIADRLFSELRHHRFLLEYDTERAGTFAPLRHVRKGAIAVLGLVSTKTAEVESKDFLKRRIDEATKFLPLEQLAISPQCGFGGADPEKPTLAEEEQWAKFERLLETATEVWGKA
jgi:5-methyltetrahydropteroyltriglutamate--homocysteine methyltransferase